MAERPDDMTYTRCRRCGGTGTVPDPGDENGLRFFRCMLCDGHGWVSTGLTLRQLDRLVERERVLAGDPGVPATRRRAVLDKVAEAVRRQSEPVPPAADPFTDLGEPVG